MLQKIALRLAAFAAFPLCCLSSIPAHAASGWDQINLPKGVTPISNEMYGINMTVFWVCVGIAVVVFGIMVYSMVRFRHSKGAVPDTTLIHSTKVEVMWTVIPVCILIGLAIPSARGLLDLSNLQDSQLTVKVTGFQWGWHYEYLKTGVSIYSKLDALSNRARELDSGIDPASVPHYLRNVDHPLVVPVGTKVLLLITSDDVIHSFWVEDLGVKKDAIPGFINESWFEVEPDKAGVYRGGCTELCGRGHGYMPIVVDAVSKADFAAWMRKQTATLKPQQAAATARPEAGTT